MGQDRSQPDVASARAWLAPLRDLSNRIRDAARGEMRGALEVGDLARVAQPVGRGAGDVTFRLDEVTEEIVTAWLAEVARRGPISLLTEDTGWRHVGPGRGGVRELDGFDHGGPRLALDPIDGTRNLMTDLRSAWTVVSFAGPGSSEPRLTDISLGIVSEIPDTRAARFRSLSAILGEGCELAVGELEGPPAMLTTRLRADEDDRVDHGYFPFFAYAPDLRSAITELEARFFERLARLEGAELNSCWDDQYISSGGQLALTAMGTYRAVIETRALMARRRGISTQVAKPYDMAGAALCASEAGCVVTTPEGEPLDFPIDTETPVDFVGYCNAATAARLQSHLNAALRETAG